MITNRPMFILLVCIKLFAMSHAILSKREMQNLLDNHNYLRANLSRNGLPDQPPAANMILMEWDDHLAELADTWAATCAYRHPDRQIHPEYTRLGQNLATATYRDIPRSVVNWYEEVKWYKYKTRECGAPRNHSCGHYTQLMRANSYRIGCGYANCKGKQGVNGLPYEHNIVCNYQPGQNSPENHIYMSGRRCSKCPIDHPFCQDGLCVRSCKGRPNCNCKLLCENGGILDTSSCQCKNCDSGFYGNRCHLRCFDFHPSCALVTSYHCQHYPYWLTRCPRACANCVSHRPLSDHTSNTRGIVSRVPRGLSFTTTRSEEDKEDGSQHENEDQNQNGLARINLTLKLDLPTGDCYNLVLDHQCTQLKSMSYCSQIQRYCRKTCQAC